MTENGIRFDVKLPNSGGLIDTGSVMTGELVLISIGDESRKKTVSSVVSFSTDSANCLVDEKPLLQRFLVTAGVEAVHQHQNT